MFPSRMNSFRQSIGLATKAVSSEVQPPSKLPPTWFFEMQRQLRELRSAKYPSECVEEAKRQYSKNTKSWRQLLAGSQGFLTGIEWPGLYKHHILWGDMYGHVNNIMYNRYVETGRVHFIRNHSQDATPDEKRQWDDLPTPRNLGLILRSITTEYKFPLEFPDHVTVLYKLLEAPTNESTSLKMEAWVLSEKNRRLAARCFDDTVIYDYTTRKRAVLKPFMVEKFQETFKKQAAERFKYTKQAEEAIQAAKELQKKYQLSSDSS